MASYISELDFPNFVQYYLTLYSSDYDMASTYGERLSFSQEEFGFFRVSNELAPTKLEACEWNLLPYDDTGNWLGVYESYLDGYREKDRLSHGFDVDTFNNADGSGWEKAAAAYLGEEHRGHYCSYNASDFSSWSGDECGSDDNFLDDDTDEVNTSYSFNWDEMKLCESIFGGWPCLLKQNQESCVEGLT